MNTNLILFRTHHFIVPTAFIMKVLHVILTNDVRFFIQNISDDEQYLSLTVSVNLAKLYQRNVIVPMEILLPVPAWNNGGCSNFFYC